MRIKKTILISSGFIALVLLAIGIFGTYKICNNQEDCITLLHLFFLHFLPIISLFLLSLITYKMREKVYQAWLHFSYFWVPLSIILVVLAPEYDTDWMFPITKGSVAFYFSVLYIIISLLLIGYKYLPPAEHSQRFDSE